MSFSLSGSEKKWFLKPCERCNWDSCWWWRWRTLYITHQESDWSIHLDELGWNWTTGLPKPTLFHGFLPQTPSFFGNSRIFELGILMVALGLILVTNVQMVTGFSFIACRWFRVLRGMFLSGYVGIWNSCSFHVIFGSTQFSLKLWCWASMLSDRTRRQLIFDDNICWGKHTPIMLMDVLDDVFFE